MRGARRGSRRCSTSSGRPAERHTSRNDSLGGTTKAPDSFVRGLRPAVGLLKTYCNRDSATRQLDDLVRKARSDKPASSGVRRTAAASGRAKLNVRERTEITERYAAGERVTDIATSLSLSKYTVINWLNRAGVERRSRGMSEAQIDEALRLYESGLSLARIGGRLPFSPQTIRLALQKRGVRMRDPHGRAR